MESIARRIRLVLTVAFSALAVTSCGSGGGAAGGSGGLPIAPAQAIGNPGYSRAHSAPKVTIKEIAIPKAPGPAMGGIAVTSDSGVYVSLDGAANTPFDIGARYANGTFTTLIIDPFKAGPPVGPVAATQNAAAHFATQVSDNFCHSVFNSECAAIASYGPPAEDEAFAITGFTGAISDMAGDSKGNLWYAVSAVILYVNEPQAFVAKVPENDLNSSACCLPLSDQTIVQLSDNYLLSTQALAVAPNGDAWVATALANSSSGRSIYHISAAGTIVRTYALPRRTNIGGIAVTSDDKVWFTDSGHNVIGRLTTRGTLSRYAIPTPASGVDRITVGPDGALWFTEKSADKIGRITANGHIHEYAVPTSNAQPAGIASLGPGCNPSVIWFVEQGADNLGELTI